MPVITRISPPSTQFDGCDTRILTGELEDTLTKNFGPLYNVNKNAPDIAMIVPNDFARLLELFISNFSTLNTQVSS